MLGKFTLLQLQLKAIWLYTASIAIASHTREHNIMSTLDDNLNTYSLLVTVIIRYIHS